MLSPLALIAALALFGTAPPANAPNLLPCSTCFSDDAYGELLDEFEAASEQHRIALLEEEDRQARSALRKKHPGYEFFPRFKALADAGNGEALMWMIDEARYCGERSKETKELKAQWCAQLVEKHLNASWFEDAIAKIAKQRSALGEERLEALLIEVVEKSERKKTQAAACLQVARLLSRSKEEAIRSRGYAYYERLIVDFADTSHARSGEAEYNRVKYLSVGGAAMDFEAKDVDGNEFKLSDFRGKVVVLDFWGFW